MKDIVLRDYQSAAIQALRDGIRAGHRAQVLCAPTGAGKTMIATALMEASAQKFSRCAFVVDRVSLVDQTSAVLDSYGIDHGIVQAGHWRRRGYEPIQVCSAQTLEKRGFFPDLKLLIVDECHCQRRQTTEMIRNHPDIIVIGLTATPLTKGLRDSYSRVVNVTTTSQLIADGWLAPLKYYAAVTPDMTGARTVAGEWAASEVEQRGAVIVGDIVGEWEKKTREHFGKPVKTIVFSASVKHGAEICEAFAKAGYRFEQISYLDGNDDRRRDLIAEFRQPDSDITGLVSCEALAKGFDVPDVLCGIGARPYRKSLSSHLQAIGRVMRPYPGKEYGIWIDHAGNCLRFWGDQQDLFANGVTELPDGHHEKPHDEPTARERDARVCSCGVILPAPLPDKCPGCGKALHSKRSLVEHVPGTLIEVGGNGKKLPDYLKDRSLVWEQLVYMARERKTDPEQARRFAQAQYRQIYGDFARRSFEHTTGIPYSDQLDGRVRSHLIRWAKGQKKHWRSDREQHHHMREIAA